MGAPTQAATQLRLVRLERLVAELQVIVRQIIAARVPELKDFERRAAPPLAGEGRQ